MLLPPNSNPIRSDPISVPFLMVRLDVFGRVAPTTSFLSVVLFWGGRGRIVIGGMKIRMRRWVVECIGIRGPNLPRFTDKSPPARRTWRERKRVCVCVSFSSANRRDGFFFPDVWEKGGVWCMKHSPFLFVRCPFWED